MIEVIWEDWRKGRKALWVVVKTCVLQPPHHIHCYFSNERQAQTDSNEPLLMKLGACDTAEAEKLVNVTQEECLMWRREVPYPVKIFQQPGNLAGNCPSNIIKCVEISAKLCIQPIRPSSLNRAYSRGFNEPLHVDFRERDTEWHVKRERSQSSSARTAHVQISFCNRFGLLSKKRYFSHAPL